MEIAFKSIRLCNVGPISDLTIDMTNDGQVQDTIVLTGANGCGKTTVLNALAYMPTLFCPNRFNEENIENEKYMQVDFLIDNVDFSLFQGKLFNENSASAVEFLGYTPAKRVKGSLHEKLHRLFHQGEKVELECKEINKISLNPEIELPGIIYFPHTRYLKKVEASAIQKEIIKHKLVYRYENVEQFEGSLNSYLIYLDYAKKKEFDLIIDFLNKLEFDGKTFEIDRENLNVLVKTKSGAKHDIDKLSSGEQNIFIMLLELRRRLVASHSIVMIDEFENSLHPAFQVYLASALKQLQQTIPFQLIITTHSRDVIKYFGTDSVRYLSEI